MGIDIFVCAVRMIHLLSRKDHATCYDKHVVGFRQGETAVRVCQPGPKSVEDLFDLEKQRKRAKLGEDRHPGIYSFASRKLCCHSNPGIEEIM